MVTDDPNSSAATLDELRRENELLRASVQQSSSELELLRAERDKYLEQLKLKDRKIDDLQHQVQALLRRYFGRSSEKMDPRQRLLFENLIDKAIPELPAEDGGDNPSPPRRNGHGRRRLPADLPREKVIHDLPEDEKPCPCCGKLRHIIGKQTHQQLDYVPAKLKVIEHVRLTYGCPQCENDASPDGPQIVTANKPLQPIEKGLAAPGLLSYVIVSKYGDHLPLHRLERILQRHGIEIARSTLCDWTAQCADALSPLTDLMKQRVLQSAVIHTDDTPVKVQDRSRTQTRTGRFWVYLGDHDHPYTVFTYTPSRNRDGPMEFLRDWGSDERVYLQADAFGGYDGIYAGEAGGHVTEVACWAHARRKFYDARSSDPAGSASALAHIKLLYDVETQAKRSAEQTAKPEATSSVKPEVPNNADAARVDESSDHDAPANRASARRFHALLVENRLRLRKDLERLTKRMFQCTQADHRAAETEESLVDVVTPFVTDAQSSELVKPAEGTFNHPAYTAQTAAVLRVAFRDYRFDPTRPQQHAVQVRVVGSIGIQTIRLATRMTDLSPDRWYRVHQRQQLRHVVPVGPGEPNGKRNALRIRDEVVFRPFLAAIRRVGAGFFAPPTARTEPLSTTARDQSIWSAARSLSSNRRWSRSQTSAACQSRRRRQQVIPEPQPISCGRYSQGMPVLSTKRIPVSASRSPTGGRPPLGRAGRLGISGLIAAHRSSVTSGLAIVVSSLTQVPLARWLHHPQSPQRFKAFC